jgi:hypothetical protein
MKSKVPIIGLYGCYCHPFSTWGECNKMNKQKIKFGDIVKNRHTQKVGIANQDSDKQGFLIVRYGELTRDLHLEHVSQLIKQPKNEAVQIMLFDVPAQEKPKPEPGRRCKNCRFKYHHIYSNRLIYCSKRRQKGTAYGDKKIKANDPACEMFKSLTENP